MLLETNPVMSQDPHREAPYKTSSYNPYPHHSGFGDLAPLPKQSDVPTVPHPGGPAYYSAPPQPIHGGQNPMRPPRPILASPLDVSEDSQGSRPGDGEQLANASAVEAARIQAQRTAESYAVLRKATASQAQLPAVRPQPQHSNLLKSDFQGEDGSGSMARSGSASRDQPRFNTAHLTDGHSADDDDDDDPTKSSRYKRRLALNRESAAVSRIRRRAYIKELEDRLAQVEKEKHELIGQVQIMLSQNEKMSSQLTECFRLVASIQKPPK